MAAFSVLSNVALMQLPPGRASVLAYCTPLWVTPLAAWRLGERISRRSLAGVALGLTGVFVIVAPTLFGGNGTQMVSCALLLGASAVWAISIVYVRGHRFVGNALQLAPWQMLVAALLTLPVAAIVERSPPRLTTSTLLSLAYVAPVATAFAYWAVVECGRRFRASTLAVALLATPAMGSTISAIFFEEALSVELLTGMALIGAGIRLVTAD
jgi:drug/metabolite transporter (DMT)-like permease